jgi:membrane associated rhomboid family serine protease
MFALSFCGRFGHPCPVNMDDITRFLARLFTEPLWYYLSWPAVAMVLGTLIGVLAPPLARQLAVVPRTAGGLVGLITAPFVHANFAHLAANLPPFVVFGALVLRRGESRFLEIALTIAAGQGVLLWLLGRKAAHVGMSGVIFGFLGYLVTLAWFTRTMPDVLVAGGVLVFYGGMLAGIAPARDGTSWEGHLFGLVAGLGTAWLQYRW